MMKDILGKIEALMATLMTSSRVEDIALYVVLEEARDTILHSRNRIINLERDVANK